MRTGVSTLRAGDRLAAGCVAIAAIAAGALALATPARAQPREPDSASHAAEEGRRDEADDEDDEDDDDVPLFSATATTARDTAPEMPASTGDFALDPGALRAVPRRRAEQLLTLAPGVALVNHSGAYHASSVLLRGFDAGEGRDLEVWVDGVPLNEPSNPHAHGYADTHFVIPELVREVRVIEGPFAADQGDFAVAGSARYALGVPTRGVLARVEAGSFDTYRLLLAWAPVGAREGTFVGADVRETGGFGESRRATSVALNARYEERASEDLSLFALAALHFADFASAGIVRRDDLARLTCRDDSFYCAADPDQGGASARALLSAGLVWQRPGSRFTQSVFGGWRRLRIRENFTGALLDDRGDGLDEQYEVATVGARGAYRVDLRALDQEQSIELGYVARHDSGVGRVLRRRAEDGVPYQADLDDELHVTHVGAYLGADLRFADFLALRAALRVDGFAFSTIDRAEPTSDRGGPRLAERASDALGVSIAPRGTARVRVADFGDEGALEWQTSAGLGTRSSDATALSTGEFAPFARVIATETGLALRLRRRGDLEARVSAFHTQVDRDFVFDPARGRNVEAGASSRLGAQAWLRVRLAPYLDLAASFAWTESFLLGPAASWSDFTSASRLPFVPRWVGRLDASFAHPIELGGERVVVGVAAGVGWLGERPLPLGGVSEPVVIADASADIRWRLVAIGVQVENLLAQRYASAVFRHASRFDPSAPSSRLPAEHFAAGAPLSVTGTLTIAFDETDPFAPLRDPHTTPSALTPTE